MKEINDLIQKLEPVLGKKAKQLWYWYLMARDKVSAEKSRALLRVLADKKARVDYQEEIRLPPPESAKLIGEYHLGETLYPTAAYGPFGLHEEDLIKHILICGMTGTGKTTLLYQIIQELARHKKPFLVFDWKRNYRKLVSLQEVQDLTVIRIGDPKCKFRFNPLIPPPGTDPKHWMTLLIDVMKHSFFVSYGPEYFFRIGIDQLYRQSGIYDGKVIYPTFADLEIRLRKEYVKGREMLWMSSAKRVMASLTFSGLLGEVLNVRKQQDLSSLLNQNVVIELDNLATLEKTFLVESLLLWIYHYRKNQGKTGKFRHAIIIEEAHHILSGLKERSLGEESIVETMIRMIREFGESVIAVDQEPSKISSSLLANTNCKICFNLGNGKDISSIAECLNLRWEEKRMIDKLQVGHAIVKMKERFSEPIHVKFPLVELESGKPDAAEDRQTEGTEKL